MKLALRGKQESQIVGMLQKVPLFSNLERKQLRAMAESFKERKYGPGETIAEEGDFAITFYLITNGSVEVKKGKKTIAKLGPSQYFGEMSLLDKAPRSASVVASEETTCLLMTSWNFMSFLQTEPKLALGIMKELARRLRETDKALSE
ncbi:MAG: cyclic nucleotide-binding domain-containing protein [Nitrososphaerales archaeon]